MPQQSARQVHLDGLRDGQLLYQYDERSGSAVFYPREVGPGGSPGALTWRRSAGLGTIYSWTVLHSRQEPRNLVLVDLDEGFRMLSTVIDADELRIGLRVQARIEPFGEIHRVVFEVRR